jgi:hypothetical protein
MLTWTRWITLILAVSAFVAWAVVSGLLVTYQGPSFWEMMAHAPPRRIGDPTFTTYDPPLDLAGLRRADVTLRIGASLLVSVHLVVLNLRGARP